MPKLQKLSEILQTVGQTATLWAPLLPQAALVALGSTLVANAASLFARNDIAVVNEDGTTVDVYVLEKAISAEWDRVLQLLTEGRAVADRETGRTS